MANLTYHDVARLLKADFEAGRLFWRERSPDLFANLPGEIREHFCAYWNGRFANTEAFTTVNDKGYFCGKLLGKRYFSHRVLWILYTGQWPTENLDHINGNPLDNRITNLREVSQAENLKNKRTPKNNTSGIQGVSWYQPSRKWAAYIRSDGKKKFLGYFTDIADAAEARKVAEVEFGYHQNHGRRV